MPVGRRPDWLLRMLVAGLLVVATGACAEPAQPHRAGWRLSWTDDFDGSNLDRTKWAAENESTFGEGNLELACLMDRPENLFVADGRLHVRAAREPTPVVCGDNDERFPKGRSYTSAMITTQGKASWREGRFAIRARLPLEPGASKGLWPAFWMRPASGPADGEVDAMEAIGTADPQDPEATVVHQTLWYDVQGTHPQQGHLAKLVGGPAGGFHTYAVEWRAGHVRWYVDGKLTFQRDRSTTPWLDEALAAKFFIRLNMAVGGRFPGDPAPSTRFPADMVVDWVKVYTWQ